ncbi:serine hydrolase domain-containing protein [Advenella sp. FME57]|uniref:serine hydrolase domain-containing protein n=1 Tax=Advenella sp. FME57 TaxID=2742604 RepID=UPI0018680C3A|nr:serine hydrolase domain-containing protein [Advenella sp. FME57]
MQKYNVSIDLKRPDLAGGQVHGYCAPQFLPVLDAFVENFDGDIEHGASLAVEQGGQTVIDVWGGFADLPTQRPWQQDTVGVVFSNTKAATALCAHILADGGALDIDQRVAHYWPEFAAQGKGDVTVRMLLDHSAGVPALRQMLPDGAVFDWTEMSTRLANEAPYWKPGTSVGYHGLTFGWLVGEVVRRVAGQSLGHFFQERVARPLGLDFWIGLPESEEPRVAKIMPARPAEQPRNAFEQAIATAPESISNLYFRNTGGWRPSGFNSRQGHAAEIGAAGGITNARSLARMYSALSLGGERNGVRVIGHATLERAAEVSSATNEDLCLLVPTRFAAGFMRSMDNRARGLDSASFGRDAFGHVGAGGSLGFASEQHRIGFGYTMNHMGAGVLLNARADRLTQALYGVLARS